MNPIITKTEKRSFYKFINTPTTLQVQTGRAVTGVARLPRVEEAVVVARAGEVAQVVVRVRGGEHALHARALRRRRRRQLVLRLQQVAHVVRRQRRQDVAQVLGAGRFVIYVG